jgi:hypothetical protein
MFCIHSEAVSRVARSIEDIDALFLTETRASIQNRYLNVVSCATELYYYDGSNHSGSKTMSAGLIPFCVNEGKVHFLFQKTSSGRRAGYLVDFGGGADDGETYR